AEFSRVLVERSQLLAIPERLLVVVTDDLVELTRGCPRRPVGISLMEKRTQFFRDAGVGSIADERVSEAVCVLATRTCTEEILARQAEQLGVDNLTLRVVGELEHGAPHEL